jgi:hypothetical protein
MKNILKQLEALVEELEDFEPPTDSVAYVRRELLTTLDHAHELLAALAADGFEAKGTREEADPSTPTA